MAKTATDTTLEAAARLRMAIVRTARRLRQEAALGAGADLTPTSASALATVERHGPLTPSELADIERVRRPTATRTLGVLLEAGLVDRTPDPADGRSSLVSINADGKERLRRLRGRKNAYLARRMRDLPDSDLQTLERAAEILEGILEEPRRTGSGEPRRDAREPRRGRKPGDTP
jgi:DNA-binding MarR family transcriptional regulator